METGKIAELMLLWDIKDKIPTAQEVAKAIVEEEAKRREDEKAYWEAWDKACKEKVIERLRNHEEGFGFGAKTYPEISQDMWADLIESGEVKLIAPTKGVGLISNMWADETREEAQREGYKKMLETYRKEIEKGEYRIVV